MKWVTLFKVFKDKVGLSQIPSSASTSPSLPFEESSSNSNNASPPRQDFSLLLSREKTELELDFKRCWEEFGSSSTEKEKEKALHWTVEYFCRLGKQHSDVAQLITMLVEAHIFSFVVGRAFVTDIDKLKLSSKTRSLEAEKVLTFFSETTKDGIRPGANLLQAVEILVSGLVDKQSFLDSGILCCLIHVLNALLAPDGGSQRQQLINNEEQLSSNENHDVETRPVRRHEVEGSVVHIMKALAGHPSAAQSLVDDNSLQLLFQMVANGSSVVFSQYKEGLVPLHAIQLHRHAMQILRLLLVNDNGSTAKYIRKHQLIRVLLMAVKDFNPDCGDPAYTVGIVDLLLESVELSYRPDAGGIRLREDIHNAHGYQFLVQFALTLSKSQGGQTFYSKSLLENDSTKDSSHAVEEAEKKSLGEYGGIYSPLSLFPALSRLLDVIISFAQTGPSCAPASSGLKSSKSSHPKSNAHGRSRSSFSDRMAEEILEKDNEKVKDLEAVQMLMDILIKAESTELQAEVLNRLLKIFSSHPENYKLCQQLRTVPLLILNMAGFPSSLQEIILKILEYAVSVVNIIPEQELLSLCCLLPQSITSGLKHTILSFFLKLLSFDQEYKKILREVGVLELLLEDLKQHTFLHEPEQLTSDHGQLEIKTSSSSFKRHFLCKDSILSSPTLLEPACGKFLIFEVEDTAAVAWDCLLSLLKKSDANQAAFRSFNGVIILLPFLASDVHRPGVLRVLSCLIIEDVKQAHPEELGALVEVLKNGMVTSALGSQYILQHDAECDTFGAVWRILRVNDSAQRVFGEATGFSLLLTMLQSFQSDDGDPKKQPSITVCINVFTYMLRVMTAGVFDNAVNRSKLQTILSSHTFYDLLSESRLICVEYECQVIQLLLELALEVVTPPFTMSEHENESAGFLLITLSGSFVTYKKRVYNAAAVRVLLRSLLLFTPNVQLELLNFIEKLACANSLNKENLTSIGCVELLLEIIHPLMSSSSSLVSHALKIVEVLGAYRLSVSELRSLVRYIMHMRLANSARCVVQMMERLIVSEDTGSGDVSLAPFVELDMSKLGHASIQVPLGQRSWPPAAGYSFVCWFQYQNLLKPQARETEAPKAGSPKRHSLISGQLGSQVLRIFSVGSVDNESTFYTELCLHDDGVLTLATSNSSSLTFAGLEMEEGRWHHLAVVHSKPNALAGLFQASFAYVYLNGKLRHTGKLGYSPSPAGKSVQVTIGTPVACARVSDLSWKLRSCFLFEEVLPPGSICFMYILGRGYRGLFQDTNLLQFVSNQACGGGSMAILDSLDIDLPSPSNTQKPDTAGKQGIFKVDGSGFVWDSYKLGNLSLQLWGKKLILALDGTSTDTIRASGTVSMLNLVDPLSATASSIWGIPRFGRLLGDIYICKQCVISDMIRPMGGMAVVLALIEAAETRDMLHMSLTLLACALHQNPQNVRDMQKYRGYHLLALFLHRRMSLFDMQSLEIFFQIAACEATFSEPRKIGSMKSTLSPTTINEASFDDLNLSKLPDEFSSVGSQGDIDDFSATKDSFSHISELETADMPTETSNCIVLSNAHMVEHVLLDWTLWVTAPVPVQISLLGFLEHLVSMHWYRNHNLTILRKINLVQHLLVTLQRGDVEVPVLEKVVMLLGVILEDGFLPSELELLVRFVIMTFDPPQPTSRNHFTRELMGKHVIVRNMLLEMLIDLQVTIPSEELLEQWLKIVSSKLITYFLDEALHPTSMRWIMTLVGVCLSFSPTFALKFRSSGGYQGLVRVLPSFYDSPDIYYILFCLIFGKPVYPRLPEVRMLDFHALMPSDGRCGELKFVELLDSVIAMAKSTFDRLCTHLMIAHQTGNISQVGASIMADLVDGHVDMGELQGEALMHKTYAARLMGGEASAPAAATSVLRFMVDLAKTCPPFSAVCRRAEFLESCIDLYFSCVRAAHAVRMTKELTVKTEEKILNDADDTSSSQNTFSSFPQEHEQSAKSSVSVGSFVQGHVSASSEDNPIITDNMASEKPEIGNCVNQQELDQLMKENVQAVASVDSEAVDQVSTATSGSNDFNFRDTRSTLDYFQKSASHSSLSFTMSESPVLTERSSSRIQRTPSSSPVLALTSWLGGPTRSDSKAQSSSTPSVDSFVSVQDIDSPSEFKPATQSQYASNTLFTISPSLILEVDGSGYGGGPCSAGATAVLDFLAEVLSDFVTEQIKAASVLETVLESVPMHADAESVLVFQGLCLTRLMNFVERRLLRDDEENEKRLEKSRWSLNLDALSWMIVDRVYMGAFPQPAGVLKTLEFLLSMLQLANKDGRIEETIPAGKGLLSLGRGNRQLDTYIHALFKNTNRIILFCFLPSFLSTIGEDDLLTRLCLQNEPKKKLSLHSSQEDGGVEILTVLQLLVANRRIIFCPSNRDTDLNCCLCVNLISLLYDHRKHVQNAAIDILKYLLVHRRAAVEEFLVSKVNQGPSVDVLHGGFDKLLTGNLSGFFEWLHSSESIVNKVLEKGAAVMWAQYIAGSTKFPGVRIKGMDSRRKREMGRRSRDTSKLEQRHWEQVNERRGALELVRDAMATELRVIRQDKYGWVVHAESEWQTHLQQLTHERGIFPINKSSMNEEELEWQLCPIEGPYRMRKKLERCRTKIDTIQNILNGKFEIGEREFGNTDNEHHAFDAESDSFLNLSTHKPKNETFHAELYNEPSFKESEDARDVASPGVGWNDDRESSINEASMHSAAEFGERSSDASAQRADTSRGKPDLGSSKLSSSVKNDEVRVAEDKSDKELNDNGEYLIRPYLEPLERIKCRYNCERVVGLDKHDGIFLIGELSLYIIENFYIDESGCICEKESEDELSIIDQALGVKKDFSCNMDSDSKSISSWGATVKAYSGGRAWAYNGGAWGKEKVCTAGNAPHPWRNWKLDSVHELLKRDYQLRPVAIEIFSMDGCNDLLVFHKKEREEVFKNLVAMNLPRNSILDATITGSTKQESNEGRLFKVAANSFSKRWQNGEISNFQYIMHLNTLAGRGYSDLTQYPVFPWVLADYESENLDLLDPKTFRNFEKPMGCQTSDREEEFRKRYESWDDPEIPKFHYGSHYSSAGIVLFYLLRLPPFSVENQKLQGGQFDHADRLFNSVRETWWSAAGKGNTSDVKELIPEFFYMPEFLENKFNLDFGEKQSGEKVGDVFLPPWAKGSAREFIRKHREALESDYVSEHLHHWIDLIFGYKQRGKAAEEAVNVFYYYTYEGSVDIDSVADPIMKASVLAQINHFGQTPKQLFMKPHAKRRTDRKVPPHPLKHAMLLVPHEIRKSSSSISQIVTVTDKVLIAGTNILLKPRTFTKCVAWGFPDRSLRFMSYNHDRLLSTHEDLHHGNQIQCVSASHDGQLLVTGADDGLLCAWRIGQSGPFALRHLQLEKALCGHTGKITCLRVSQPYMMIVSGSDDCTVIIWDLSSLVFIRQLPEFPSPVSAIYVNELNGEIVTAAGVLLAIWSINGDCLAVNNATQLPSDFILSLTGSTFSDWLETNWYVSGHQSGDIKVWKMVHSSSEESAQIKETVNPTGGLGLGGKVPEYRLILHKVLKFHKFPVTALRLSNDLKQLLSGDSDGHLVSWTLRDESLRASMKHR